MYPTLHKTIYATLILTVCFALTPVHKAFAEDPTAEQNRANDPGSTQVLLSPGDTQVLEDLVVSRKRVSADEVVYESDDTMTVHSADDFDAYKALSSGAGAAVNFNIAFAVDSIIMTASGRSAVEQMANALRYFSRDTSFELLVHGSETDRTTRDQRLVQGRINELVRKLRRHSGVESERLRVVYTKQNKSGSEKPAPKAETLPLTLVNMG